MNIHYLTKPCDSARRLLDEAGFTEDRRKIQVLWQHLEPLREGELTDYPDLKYVCVPATGTDHVDGFRCKELGVRILTLRDTDILPQITATAEHTIGLILALVRKIPQAVESTKRGEWDRSRFMGRELRDMEAVIVGEGRVGGFVRSFLTPLVCNVGSIGPMDVIESYWPGILGEYDIVTIHVNLNESTRGMCDTAFFAAMKAGSYFINTSRGQVVDEAALLAALKSGHLAGAALDVVCGEPDGISHELIAYANQHPDKLILTPHIGGYCVESLEKSEVALAKKLIEVVNGKTE